MTDVASLVLAVDSRQVKEGATSLDGLTSAGKKAEESARDFEKSQVKVSQALTATGLSAKQMSAAMRGVPAQFTDIFTSIAAGQSPLQVMLQQGGQLKDMFGGIGPAADALGGYMRSLVTRTSIAAAAVGALGVAYYQGSKEADGFRAAILLTGNAAGTSVDNLTRMTEQLSESTRMSKGLISEAVTQAVATAKISSNSLQAVVDASVRLERAAGIAISDTIKQFKELGKSPVSASLELNQQVNFLTASIYGQIRALEEQGRTAEAAALAQQTYAKALKDRSKEIENSLGFIEKAWRGVTSGAKNAWDAMLGVGRAATLEERLKSAEASANALRERNQVLSGRGIDSALSRFLADRQKGADAEVARLREQIAKEKEVATAKEETNKKEAAGIAWLELKSRHQSKQQQMAIEIAKAEKIAREAGANPNELKSITDSIREKYTPKTSGGRKEIDEYNSLIRAIREKTAEQGLEATQTEKLLDSQKFAAKFAIDIATGQLNLSQAHKVNAAALIEEMVAQEKSNVARKEEETLAKAQVAALNDHFATLEAQVIAREEEYRSIGMSNEAIRQNIISQLELARTMVANEPGREKALEFYEKEIALRRRLDAAESGIEKKSEALQVQKGLWRSIEGSAHDAFMNIGRDGENVFDRLKKSLENGLLELLYQMTVKKWIIQIEQSISGQAAGQVASSGGGLLGGLFEGSIDAGSLGALGEAIIPAFGFANGGDFTVGGVGGTDSQNVTFRATPGEKVSIRTPSQSGDGGTVNNFSFSINAQGADIGVAARIEEGVKRAVKLAVATVASKANSGGDFAKALGRRR